MDAGGAVPCYDSRVPVRHGVANTLIRCSPLRLAQPRVKGVDQDRQLSHACPPHLFLTVPPRTPHEENH